MYRLKELTEKRNDLVVKMASVLDKAKEEKRALSAEDEVIFSQCESDVKLLDQEIRAIEMEREKSLKSHNTGSLPKAMKDAILPGEHVEQRAYQGNSNLDFGKLVRGMAGKGWEDAQAEHEEFRAMSSANSVVVPQILADQIVDIARSQSAVFGQIPIIQMENNNITVAAVKQEATASFVAEGDLIPASDVLFDPVELKGKTLAIFVPVSEQLLDSAKNLTNVLMNTCAAGIANTLDKKLIYGDGITEIKGLSLYDTIGKVSHDKQDYDGVVKAVKAVKANNVNPTNIVYNTDFASTLAMLKDLQGQYVTPPKMLDNYIKMESNNLNNNEILAYDLNSLLLGLHKSVTMEWGVTTDMFQRIQKGLRIYLRCDLALIRPKGIALTTVTVA